MLWNIEVTDTFSGEANYCWVRRYTMDTLDDASATAIVRKAKRLAGWSGMRTKTADFGDRLEVRPVGSNAPCVVMFINVDI